MKHLLLSLTLILSANAWAETINLSCNFTSSFNVKENSSSPTGDIMSISINTDEKKLTSSKHQYEYGYKEMGNLISWNVFSTADMGSEMAFIWEYKLDRFTGNLENTFYTQSFEGGYDFGNSEHTNCLFDKNCYEIGLVHTAMCQRVEALF